MAPTAATSSIPTRSTPRSRARSPTASAPLLYQECTVKNGRIVEENFDTYPMMLMEDFPKIETVLVPSGGFWGGVGEPTICVAAPAVLNAIYAATGKSITTLR